MIGTYAQVIYNELNLKSCWVTNSLLVTFELGEESHCLFKKPRLDRLRDELWVISATLTDLPGANDGRTRLRMRHRAHTENDKCKRGSLFSVEEDDIIKKTL